MGIVEYVENGADAKWDGSEFNRVGQHKMWNNRGERK
jgi:hypothetical protein